MCMSVYIKLVQFCKRMSSMYLILFSAVSSYTVQIPQSEEALRSTEVAVTVAGLWNIYGLSTRRTEWWWTGAGEEWRPKQSWLTIVGQALQWQRKPLSRSWARLSSEEHTMAIQAPRLAEHKLASPSPVFKEGWTPVTDPSSRNLVLFFWDLH